jgi:hypothetical protein
MANSIEGSPRIGVAEAIAELASELKIAHLESAKRDVQFVLEDIEVELALEFAWTREVSGGFKLFSFLDLGGKTGAADKATNKVKLKMTVDQKDFRINRPHGPAPVVENESQ